MSSVLRAALRAWYALRLVELRTHRRPTDSAVTRSGDPRADRILLLGNGFTHGLRDLLASMIPRLRPEVPVLVVGIPPVNALSAFNGVAVTFARRHRVQLNAVTARVCTEYRADYLDIAEFARDRRDRADPTAVYGQLASRIAVQLAPSLMLARPAAQPRPPHADPIWEWSGTEEVVSLAATGGSPVLRRLAETAQKAFQVELAVVSLVNGDRLYYGNNTEVMPESVPLDLSFCQYTVAADAPVIVPDVRADERFVDNPLIELSYINFYAGYPLHGSDGRVIGSFCLQGSRARNGSAVSLEALRGMALQAEAELRRFEKTSQPPAPTGPAYTF